MYEFERIKNDVLLWLDSLKVEPSNSRYKFHADSDDTLFCSCFALFILDLFKETEKLTSQHKQEWISHIQSFQNKEYGYFEPERYFHEDRERNRYQLTCFCLSALAILGAEPEIPLKFTEQWKTSADVRKYLLDRGCHEGKPGSGNKAMFLAIFLTHEYERTGDSRLLDKIDAWFEFHNEMQNRNGFWGAELKSHYLHGLQNGFHQFVIYFYWKKSIPKLNRIVDVALMAKDRDGFFAPTPGGDACHDYDAIHTLAMAHRTSRYRKRDIEACLRTTFNSMLCTLNDDGGFCQSKCKLTGPTDFLRHIPTYFSGRSPYLWYFRARASLIVLLKQKHRIYTGWTEEPRAWCESNLWDTWFRCLTMAEIAHTIDNENIKEFRNVSFHKSPGIGYFPE